MRKVLLILGGLIVLLVGGVVSFALYSIGQKDLELNRKKTAPARAAKLGLVNQEEPKQVENENEIA